VNGAVGAICSARYCAGGDGAGAPSLIKLAVGNCFFHFPGMEVPRRKSLPREIPSWVDPQKEIYFISINCEVRFKNQLALPEVAEKIFETINHGKNVAVSGVQQIVADMADASAAISALGSQRWDVVADFIIFTPEQLEQRLNLFRGRVEQFIFISSATAYQKSVTRPQRFSQSPADHRL
jgi:hypothetical protein